MFAIRKFSHIFFERSSAINCVSSWTIAVGISMSETETLLSSKKGSPPRSPGGGSRGRKKYGTNQNHTKKGHWVRLNQGAKAWRWSPAPTM